MKKAENSKLELFFEKLRLFGSQFFPAIFRFLKSKLAIKILLTLVIGTVALVTFFWFAHCQDEPPPDDSMFMQKVPKIQDEENAFELLSKAGEAIKIPEDEKEREKVWDIARGNVEWDQTFVDKILEDNKEAFKLYDEGMKKPKLQCPYPFMPYSSFLIPWLPAWNTFGSLNAIRVLNYFHSGSPRKAFVETFKQMRFGHLIQSDAGGGLINYLVGRAIKLRVLRGLRDILPKLSLPLDELKQAIETLTKYRANEENLKNMICTEYRYAVYTIENNITNYFEDGEESKLSLNYVLFKLGYTFKPNKTKRYFATKYKCRVRNIPLFFNQLDFEAIGKLEREDIFEPKTEEHELSFLGFTSGPELRRENRFGNVTYTMFFSISSRDLFQKKCTENIEVEVTRILFALKCFKDEKGKLPETLDELVPEYLDKVPIDDFDGKPLKYSKKEKRVYSSGNRRKGDKEEPLSFDIEF